jgi:hypothetical protein
VLYIADVHVRPLFFSSPFLRAAKKNLENIRFGKRRELGPQHEGKNGLPGSFGQPSLSDHQHSGNQDM